MEGIKRSNLKVLYQVKALFGYDAQSERDLSFKKGKSALLEFIYFFDSTLVEIKSPINYSF